MVSTPTPELAFFYKPDDILTSPDGKIYYNPNMDPTPADPTAVNVNLKKAAIPPITDGFEHLTRHEVDHFLEHGWLHVPNAVAPKYLEDWPKDLFVRLPGWDENDKSTWQDEYTQVSRIREAPAAQVIPKAWAKVIELAGGEHMLDDERDSMVDDHFIINFGSAAKAKEDPAVRPPEGLTGWHTDDEWYRQFLDSSGDAMTLLVAWSDIPEGGGGTWIAEDGTKGVCQYLLNNSNGLDVPNRDALTTHIPSCKKFHQFTAQKGDVIITHGLLPHRAGNNYLHYPRVISNPHVCLANPHNFNRAGGQYSVLEQYILRNLGRDSIQEFTLSAERALYLPYHAMHEEARAQRETEAMIDVVKDRGEDPSKLDCVYFMEEGSAGLKAYRRRHGLNLPIKNVADWQGRSL